MRYADGIGLDTLVEAHDEAELERAVALGAPVIGINARDLSTFAIDRRAQLELVARAPRDRVIVAESAIHTRAQGAAAELAGADAILVGSSLMQAADPGAEAARAGLAPAREGLRADARGGRRGRRRGGRRPLRLHPRAGLAAAADGVLPVPDTVLSVAVFVGEADDNGCRPRPALPAPGGQGARPRRRAAPRRRAGRDRRSTCPWQEDGSRPPRRARATSRDASCSPAGSARTTSCARSRRRARGRSTRARALEACAGSQGPRRRFGRSWRRPRRVSYGDVRRPLRPRDADPGARRARRGLGGGAGGPVVRARSSTGSAREYAGRPTPLTLAERFAPGQAALPEARGPDAHRRAQAEQRARPGRARAAARQDADHRRDRRRPARRRHRDRLRALRPRVRRLHGLRGHAPPASERRADGPPRRRGAAGRVRDEDAEGGDERGDPRLDHERRDDALPDRLVRRPGSRTRRSSASSRR